MPAVTVRSVPVRALLALAVAAALLAACSSDGSDSASPSTIAATTSTTVARSVPSTTAWVCRPGLAKNPCEADLTATVVSSTGEETVKPAKAAVDPPIDCFYVYPTISEQSTPNATITVDPQVRGVTVAQAARFSSVCRVYAPVYPQLTLSAITGAVDVQANAAKAAYAGVETAWEDYLANDNGGRGFVLLGHSQGAGLLTQLVRSKIDKDPALRKRMVSALLIGGNIIVPAGKDVGGTFVNVPACRAEDQLHCVVAYSAFGDAAPAGAVFGRPVSRFSDAFGGGTVTDPEVLCTNPAALGGGPGALQTYVETAPLPGVVGALAKVQFAGALPEADTPWVGLDGRYSGKCENAGGANVLRVTPVGAAPKLIPEPDPTWGLHIADVNLPLGNLVALVRSQRDAYVG